MKDSLRMENGVEKPLIIAFLCNWCSYEGADAAGRARLDVEENIRVARVACCGRVEPSFILEAFASGAEGVMILGCPPKDCHYREGNIHALRRYHLLAPLLSWFGIESYRFRIDWVASLQKEKFVELTRQMTREICLQKMKQGR